MCVISPLVYKTTIIPHGWWHDIYFIWHDNFGMKLFWIWFFWMHYFNYDNFDAIGNKFGMRRIVYVLTLEKSDLVADYRFERTGWNAVEYFFNFILILFLFFGSSNDEKHVQRSFLHQIWLENKNQVRIRLAWKHSPTPRPPRRQLAT